MVYNMFLLNLRLDPGIFDPFSGEILPQEQVINCCQDSGDCYELVEDFPCAKDVSPAGLDIGFNPAAYDLEENSVELSRLSMILTGESCVSCLTCLRCSQSCDPFAGSSSHVCHNTGEVILDEHYAGQCPHYVPGQTSSEIEY